MTAFSLTEATGGRAELHSVGRAVKFPLLGSKILKVQK